MRTHILHYQSMLLVGFLSAGVPYVMAQRVGIGVATPLSTLHINSTESIPLRVEASGISSAQTGFFLDGNIAGNVGIVSNRMVLMARNNRTLALGTQNINWIFLSTTGNLGLSTETPDERITINNGNIQLNSSNKGIMLNGADRPIITRGFDAFTSGNYEGLGRWGLFMEPFRLTLGVPDVAGRGFEWARYAINSTRTTLMTLDNTAKLSRPAQGNADLLPIAIGSLSTLGNIQGGTGNFTVAFFDGYKEITLSGINYNSNQFVTVCTVVQEGVIGYATTEAVNNKLRIRTYNQSGTPSNRPVHFVVYKLF